MSIQRSVDRAEQSKELDRQTWADLDAVDFQFIVDGNGEAIAGPFYFGRAFDAPPAFSFSAALISGSSDAAPQITIGVSEWIQDEQTMYVGCYLWVIFENCFDHGPTHGLIVDDHFENTLAAQGGGPEGDEIPYVSFTWFEHPLVRPAQSFTDLYWPSNYVWPSNYPGGYPKVAEREVGDLTTPYTWVQLWGGLDNSFHDEPIQRWRVSSTVKRSGQYSLYCDELIEPSTKLAFASGGSALLNPANLIACTVYPDLDRRRHLWGWRCEPGTSVKITGYRRHSWSSPTLGTETVLRAWVSFYGDTGIINPVTGPQPYGSQKEWDYTANANQWHYFEFSEDSPWGSNPGPTAPDGTRYVRIEFDVAQFWLWRFDNSTPVPLSETWLDDITIELIGDQTILREPEFDVNIKFGGRTLKNYVGAYPLRSYEAPTRVHLS